MLKFCFPSSFLSPCIREFGRPAEESTNPAKTHEPFLGTGLFVLSKTPAGGRLNGLTGMSAGPLPVHYAGALAISGWTSCADLCPNFHSDCCGFFCTQLHLEMVQA